MSVPGGTAAARTLWRGRLLIITAALLWGTGGVWAKSPPLAACDPTRRGLLLGCWRAGFAALFLAILLRPRQVFWRPSMAVMVLAFAVMNACVMLAMSYTSAAASIVLQYTSVFWVTALARFSGETVRGGEWWCAAMALMGVFVLMGGELSAGSAVGAGFALISGLAYAVVVVCLRSLRDAPSAWLVWLNHFGAWVLLLGPAWQATREVKGDQWAVLCGMGVLQMGVPYWLFARGLRTVSAAEAAIWSLLEPVSTPLWTWLWWGEAVSAATWLGGGLILAALLARMTILPRSPAVSREDR